MLFLHYNSFLTLNSQSSSHAGVYIAFNYKKKLAEIKNELPMFLVSKEVNEPAFFSVFVRGPKYPFLFIHCYQNTNNALVTAN